MTNCEILEEHDAAWGRRDQNKPGSVSCICIWKEISGTKVKHGRHGVPRGTRVNTHNLWQVVNRREQCCAAPPMNNVVLHPVNNVVLHPVNNVVLHPVNNVVLHPYNY